MKKCFKFLNLVFFIGITIPLLNAQSNIVSYNYKKGEILDILLITGKPDGKAIFQKYRETAFPIAVKMTYQPMPSFGISESTQGNHQPENFIFAKWKDLENREKFINDIENQLPDFHQMRRDIWTIFDLTYYEIQKELNFKINKDKYNVVTAYWQNESTLFSKFKKAWLRKSKKLNGQIILELTNGKSPFGYLYQPDYLVITEWENKSAFEAFYKANLKMNHKGVKHVNQFVLS